MPTAADAIAREHVESFVDDLLRRWKPATAANRYRALQRFFRFAVEEGEISTSPMRNMSPPKVPESPPDVLEDDQLRDLLKACDGSTFDDRRDAAIICVFIDTGARLAEVAGLRIDDLDLDQLTLLLTQTKGRARGSSGSATVLLRRSTGTSRSPNSSRGARRGVVARIAGAAHAERRSPGRAAACGSSRHRAPAPAPVPTHVRPPMSPAEGVPEGDLMRLIELTHPRDGEPLRSRRPRRLGPRSAPTPKPWGSLVNRHAFRRRNRMHCAEVTRTSPSRRA